MSKEDLKRFCFEFMKRSMFNLYKSLKGKLTGHPSIQIRWSHHQLLNNQKIKSIINIRQISFLQLTCFTGLSVLILIQSIEEHIQRRAERAAAHKIIIPWVRTHTNPSAHVCTHAVKGKWSQFTSINPMTSCIAPADCASCTHVQVSHIISAPISAYNWLISNVRAWETGIGETDRQGQRA